MGWYCSKCHIMTAGHLVFVPAKRRLVCLDCFWRLTGRYPLPSLPSGAGLLEPHVGGYLLPRGPAVPKGAKLSGSYVVRYPYSAPQRTLLFAPGMVQYRYSPSQRTIVYTPGVVQYPREPGLPPQWLWTLITGDHVSAAIAIPITSDDDDEA